MQLNQSSTDFGLVYVFPLNDHYVLINSGLPWWTPAAPKEGVSVVRTSMMVPSMVGALSPVGDFILFKNTPDNIISQGNFDNEWTLPVTEATKLKASGVVILK